MLPSSNLIFDWLGGQLKCRFKNTKTYFGENNEKYFLTTQNNTIRRGLLSNDAAAVVDVVFAVPDFIIVVAVNVDGLLMLLL